jgi:hypothetical protein
MADYTHVHTHSVQAAGETKSGGATVTSKKEIRARPQVATGQTVFNVVLELNVSKLKSLFWTSDKAVTITPYNGETPADPITLAAGGVLSWYEGSGLDCPLAADTTAVKVANSSGATATLDLIHLVDPTAD